MAQAIATLDSQKTAIENQAKSVEELKAKAEELEARLNTPTFGAGSEGKSVLPKDVRENMLEYIRTGKSALREAVNEKLAEYGKSLNLSVAEEGGIFYSVTHDTDIMPLVRDESPMWQEATVINISGAEYSGLMQTADLESGWVGELEDRSDTDAPTYAELKIPVHEIYAQPAATTKMLEDSEYDIEGDLNRQFGEVFAREANAKFTKGNGKKCPRGLLTYTASTTPTGRQVLYVATGADGDWAASDPHLKLLGAPELLKASYRQNGKWMMSRLRKAEVMKFLDGNKLPIWQPSLQAGTPSTLCGYPVVDNEDMPTKASNSLSVAFGDFKRAYKIISRRGLVLLRDPYTKKGWVKFYATMRAGGDVADTNAYLVFKFAGS
jgi:HK97 family phage major capsid protein